LCCRTTGSAARTGITGFFTILPVVLAGFFGGTLIDRLVTSAPHHLRPGERCDHRNDSCPALHHRTGVLAVDGAGVPRALLDAPGNTAREALLPELAKQAGMPLERATSLIHVIERGSRLVGAPLAGFLIGIWARKTCVAGRRSFFVSAGIIWAIIPGKMSVEEGSKPGGYFDELQEGLRFIRMDGIDPGHRGHGHADKFLDAISAVCVLRCT
jgi:hypothetical protein